MANEKNVSKKSTIFIKFPHSAITKAPGLLPMMYSISELCDELGVTRGMVRSWIEKGLPYEQERNKYIWIYGNACSEWIEAMRNTRKRTLALNWNEGYCFRCKKPVEMRNLTEVYENGYRRLSGECSKCHCVVNKGVKRGQQRELQTDTKVPPI